MAGDVAMLPDHSILANLRVFADIAEAGDKPHWAKAMRDGADEIRSTIDSSLRMQNEIDHLTADLAEAKSDVERITKAWKSSFDQAMENGSRGFELRADVERLKAENRKLREFIHAMRHQIINLKFSCDGALAAYVPIDAPKEGEAG